MPKIKISGIKWTVKVSALTNSLLTTIVLTVIYDSVIFRITDHGVQAVVRRIPTLKILEVCSF